MYLQKEKKKKKLFLLAFWRPLTKRVRSRSEYQLYGSEDPDSYQNVTDPRHWYRVLTKTDQNWRRKQWTCLVLVIAMSAMLYILVKANLRSSEVRKLVELRFCLICQRPKWELALLAAEIGLAHSFLRYFPRIKVYANLLEHKTYSCWSWLCREGFLLLPCNN